MNELWANIKYNSDFHVSIIMFYFAANTRVIKQSSLQKFQEEMGAVQKDPYRVVMRQSKLPMSLLHDRVKAHVSTLHVNLSALFLYSVLGKSVALRKAAGTHVMC